MKNSKFKLPSLYLNDVKPIGQTIEINTSLLYSDIKPLIKQLFESKKPVTKIRCNSISEFDVIGIQFIIALYNMSPKIEIEIDFTSEAKELLKKTGFDFLYKNASTL